MGVDYFTKWIEAKLVANVTNERVGRFYWKKIMSKFVLSSVIILDNETQFSSATVTDFCWNWGCKQSSYMFSTRKPMDKIN